MERLKTNIIEFDKLSKTPCITWLRRFESGKIDAHKAFIKYGQEYKWLYENSPYDLIRWEIEQGVFDWWKNSWAVAMYCPEHFNSERYNWNEYSEFVVKFCPQYFDPDKYNWNKESWYVAVYLPEHFDTKRYNWTKESLAVALYRPELLDPERYDWIEQSWAVAKYCPEKLDPYRFNWEDERAVEILKSTAPEKLLLRPF